MRKQIITLAAIGGIAYLGYQAYESSKKKEEKKSSSEDTKFLYVKLKEYKDIPAIALKDGKPKVLLVTCEDDQSIIRCFKSDKYDLYQANVNVFVDMIDDFVEDLEFSSNAKSILNTKFKSVLCNGEEFGMAFCFVPIGNKVFAYNGTPFYRNKNSATGVKELMEKIINDTKNKKGLVDYTYGSVINFDEEKEEDNKEEKEELENLFESKILNDIKDLYLESDYPIITLFKGMKDSDQFKYIKDTVKDLAYENEDLNVVVIPYYFPGFEGQNVDKFPTILKKPDSFAHLVLVKKPEDLKVIGNQVRADFAEPISNELIFDSVKYFADQV